MRISFSSRGSFDKTDRFLANLKKLRIEQVAEMSAQRGVEALRANTPRESGLAAQSWSYRVRQNGRGVVIEWLNSDVENGFPVAIALQYGYGTGTGGYVSGRDYINPAMRPIFDKIAQDVWKAVTSA